MKAFLTGRFLSGLLLLVLSPSFSFAEPRGVIEDPDGFVNVRAGQSTDAEIVAKVKQGERFEFDHVEDSDWCKVTLSSGKTGWMHLSRIRIYLTEKDLAERPKGKDNTELGEYSRSRKVDYYAVTRRAARGDVSALKKFLEFAEDVDGGAAEGYYSDFGVVFHLVGDEKLAAFLSRQPLSVQLLTRRAFASVQVGGMDSEYLIMRFPKTSAIFYRAEITNWPSPDGKFAIRKTIENPTDVRSSKVSRAELIEKESGKAVLDLTADDIGTGEDREGEVIWSPDSKRFAYMSVNLHVEPPPRTFLNLKESYARKQTVVFQKTDAQFTKVPLSFAEPPGRKEDRALKGATLDHVYIEPARWPDANTLLLERHDYFDSAGGGIERYYDITVTFPAEGEPTVKWKLHEER